MMRIPPGRRSLDAYSRVEALESRDLLAAPGHVLPSPSEMAPAVVVATASHPVLAGAPEISNVQFEPLTGRILVTFPGTQSGLDAATLTDPANYQLQVVKLEGKLPATDQSRPKAGVVLAPRIKVTGVTLANPASPLMDQTVVVTINNNQPLRDGVYRLRISADGIRDLEGRALDGLFTGTFPTGGGQTAGDFVADLVETHHTVLPARAVPGDSSPPAPPTTGTAPARVFLPTVRATTVRYAAAKPGGFMLAGGNNITLIPLPRKNFPGTFRPVANRH